MTIKELQIIMDRAKKEVDEERDRWYQRKLNKIREEVYELNKEVGFYEMVGMDYKEFLEAMKGYSFGERMRIAYALFLHIKILDNIVFDEEGDDENIRS